MLCINYISIFIFIIFVNNLYTLISFFLRFYLFIHERHTHRERERETETETQAEGEAGSMQGARRGTRSRVSRITPWTEVSCLVPPSAQGVILGTWDWIPCRAPCVEPASPSACVSVSLSLSLSLSLCLSWINK